MGRSKNVPQLNTGGEDKQAIDDVSFLNVLDSFDTAIYMINNKCADGGCDRKYIQEKMRKAIPSFFILAGIDPMTYKQDKQVMESIRKIVERGNNAEVKKRSDGSLTVYEVKKNIVSNNAD